jgi:hypothetical protein
VNAVCSRCVETPPWKLSPRTEVLAKLGYV